jgi:hypothetical protein
MMELHRLRRVSATRLRPRFRSYSIDIMAYRLAVIEQFAALTVAEGKGTFGKQNSPTDRPSWPAAGSVDGQLS